VAGQSLILEPGPLAPPFTSSFPWAQTVRVLSRLSSRARAHGPTGHPRSDGARADQCRRQVRHGNALFAEQWPCPACEFWVDAQGRLLRIDVPSQGISARARRTGRDSILRVGDAARLGSSVCETPVAQATVLPADPIHRISPMRFVEARRLSGDPPRRLCSVSRPPPRGNPIGARRTPSRPLRETIRNSCRRRNSLRTAGRNRCGQPTGSSFPAPTPAFGTSLSASPALSTFQGIAAERFRIPITHATNVSLSYKRHVRRQVRPRGPRRQNRTARRSGYR